MCLTHPGSIGLSTSACLQCRTPCAVVKGKSRETLVDVDRTRAPRRPRATARWSTSREHTPGVCRKRLRARTIPSTSSARGRRHAQNVGSMKKARSRERDELRRSYKRSDFPAGFTRGKYAARLAAGSNVVVLSPENAAAFPTSDAVNEALDGLVRVAKSTRLTSRSSGRRSG